MKSVDARYVTANIQAFPIRSLIATLEDFGLNPSPLTVGLGVTMEDLADPACRISFRQGRNGNDARRRLARASGDFTGQGRPSSSVRLARGKSR